MKEWLRSLSPWGPFVARVVLGVIFLAHGSQKLFGWFGGGGWSATIEGFRSMGLPMPVTAMVILIEFFGGLALVLGVCSRLAGLAITAVMLGAIVTVHAQNGFFMNWFMEPDKGHGIEMNLALIGLALSVACTGPGRLALECTWCRDSQG